MGVLHFGKATMGAAHCSSWARRLRDVNIRYAVNEDELRSQLHCLMIGLDTLAGGQAGISTSPPSWPYAECCRNANAIQCWLGQNDRF